MQRLDDRQQEAAANGPGRTRPQRRMRCLGVLLATITVTCGASLLWAQSDVPKEINQEPAIKAAYLYNFGRYVVWPSQTYADNRSPFVIGVLGADHFGQLLDDIAANKQIEGRPIVARRFASMASYQPCHILFVAAATPPAQKAEAIRIAQRGGILLVGEESGFTQQGGIVNFVIEQNKVRFEINVAAAEKASLKISSKLLGLAKIVEEY